MVTSETKSINNNEREILTLISQANDKEKAVEIALLIALGLLTKADGFAKELDKCTKERNPEQLLKLLSTVGKN